MGGQIMLKSIFLSGVASYKEQGTKFDELQEINFIYGNNGTGKSTLSRYFNNDDKIEYENCSIEGELPETVFVYNDKFIADNFHGDNELPGIFTLGEEHVDKEKRIKSLRDHLETHKNKLGIARENLVTSKDELKKSKEEFIENIWKEKIDKNTIMYKIYEFSFKGFHNSKKNFYNQYREMISKTIPKHLKEEDLLSEYNILENLDDKINEISEIQSKKFDYEIFKTSIIGKENLDLGELIKELEIQEWVYNGYSIVLDNDLKDCPFCRQALGKDILRFLERFFDDKYEKNLNKFRKCKGMYHENYNNLVKSIQKLLDLNNRYIDKDKLRDKLNKIKIEHEKNIQKLEKKDRKPSLSVKIYNFAEDIYIINKVIRKANIKTREHNKAVEKIEEKQEKFKERVWVFFVNRTQHLYDSFLNIEEAELKKQKGLNTSIDKLKKHKTEIKEKINKIEQSVYGVRDTVVTINKQLQLFGFKDFLLDTVKDKYMIIRQNGEPADKSLSEGEKTFITFLYYYHLVKNDHSKKLVFIDDPISSLDSSVLHIVSTLVQDLIKNKKTYNIEQILVSTHNIYFYKEVTFNIKNCGFYILRKDIENGSYVKKYERNPISDSYESLWKELVELRDSNSNLIQNVMRRILENYFKFTNSKEIYSLLDNFNEQEGIIVKSLIKWVQDGSHSINDDLYIQDQEENNKNYYRIFQKIFEKTGHEEHFKMMVKRCVKENSEDPFNYNIA